MERSFDWCDHWDNMVSCACMNTLRICCHQLDNSREKCRGLPNISYIPRNFPWKLNYVDNFNVSSNYSAFSAECSCWTGQTTLILFHAYRYQTVIWNFEGWYLPLFCYCMNSFMWLLLCVEITSLINCWSSFICINSQPYCYSVTLYDWFCKMCNYVFVLVSSNKTSLPIAGALFLHLSYNKYPRLSTSDNLNAINLIMKILYGKFKMPHLLNCCITSRHHSWPNLW